jgi:hypothetical protein
MRIFFTSFLLALIANVPIFAQFVSEGNHVAYTFDYLSTINTSGVTKNGGIYTVANDITIKATDTLRVEDNDVVKLANNVTIYVEGQGDFAPEHIAVFTRSDDSAAPKGVYFRGDPTPTVIKNIIFEYGGVRFTKESKVVITNCVFTHINKGLGTFALGMGTNTVEVTNCRFISNQGPAISNGANIVTNLTFKNNYLYDNNTTNTNAPQINVTCAGNAETIITNNTLIGTGRDKVGAIAVANLMGIAGSHTAVIDSNYMTKHRYGITVNGGVNTFIRYNQIIDNGFEPIPNNGGSGISLYAVTKAIITGNRIQDNLWGVTVISGTGDVNLGKQVLTEDYNPGLNIFKNNGNGGELYDLYNNSANTVYAQGNTWNVEVQDAEHIETVIFHKNDDPTLGEVIYMPSTQGNSVPVIQKDEIAYFDDATKSLVINSAYSQIIVYASNGSRVFDTNKQGNRIALPHLAKGIYMAKITDGVNVSVVKFAY